MPSVEIVQKLIESRKLEHIAIIMDGNGRWAKANGFQRKKGHLEGIQALHRTIDLAISYKLPYLTVYGFSAENINRSEGEVKDLFGILRYYLDKEVNSLIKKNIAITIIGDLSIFSKDIAKSLKAIEVKTADATGLKLTVALGYGSRQELVKIGQDIANKVSDGSLVSDDIDLDYFKSHLLTKNTPSPDLLIRTSGEKRLSNFLLWQLAYTELYFTDCLWPDFNADEFESAMIEFSKRIRRFGR